MRKLIYGVYDTKDYDLPVIIDFIDKIAEFFNTSTNVLYCSITRKSLIKGRYEIVRIK